MSYSKEDLRDLYDGRLPWHKTFEIMSKPKDDDRFDKYVEILQERVSYPERILMPMGDHLNVVQKGGERVVKCDCACAKCESSTARGAAACSWWRRYPQAVRSYSMPCPT